MQYVTACDTRQYCQYLLAVSGVLSLVVVATHVDVHTHMGIDATYNTSCGVQIVCSSPQMVSLANSDSTNRARIVGEDYTTSRSNAQEQLQRSSGWIHSSRSSRTSRNWPQSGDHRSVTEDRSQLAMVSEGYIGHMAVGANKRAQTHNACAVGCRSTYVPCLRS